MIFNGVQKEYITVLKGKERPVITRIDHEMINRRIKRSRLEALEIVVPVLIVAPDGLTLEETKEDMSSWLFHRDDKKLMFVDNPIRYYMARLQEINLVDHDGYADGEIKFICQNPYRFGSTKSINVTTTATNHTITGQAETPWTAEVNFTANRSRFEFWVGDIYLQLNYNFIAGDKLLIEYTGRKVTLNGIDRRNIVSMSSHFEELKPGTVSFRASHAAKIIYDERYY